MQKYQFVSVFRGLKFACTKHSLSYWESVRKNSRLKVAHHAKNVTDTYSAEWNQPKTKTVWRYPNCQPHPHSSITVPC